MWGRDPRARCRRRLRARAENGAAAVEFALVLLPLTLLIFGIVQYGFYFFASQAASSAADSAARRVSVGDCQNATDLTNFVKTRVANALPSSLVVDRQYEDASGNPVVAPTPVVIGDQVVITVKFDTLDLHFPFIPLPGNATVIKQTSARIEDLTPNGTCI